MCGISGFLNLDNSLADPQVLRHMIRTLDHRGPDGSGVYRAGPMAMAHSRLGIIDLEGGHQPMSCDDGSLWITFNGEIFNYIELRQDLIQKGHTFLTRSDTEVILRLYREYGPDCVTHMNGQWAFALWDARKKVLFLSRDRLGVRPLFYASTGNSFIFASEVKAMLAHPALDRSINLQALRQIFTLWFPVAPGTIFKGICEIPPGHSLLIEDGEISTHRYWQIDFSRIAEKPQNAHEEARYTDELCNLLTDATKIRLRADVPVGAYLSGGLDSSIVTALAQKCVGAGLCTFSVAFEDPQLDESAYQRKVVERLNTQHHSIRCSSSDIGRAFPEVIWHTERPVLRTAPAPLFLLSKLVREYGFKVVLTGEGSDEFMGGYDIYKEAKIRAFWAAQIESTLRPQLLRRLYPYLQEIQGQSPAYLKAIFHVSARDAADPFFSHTTRWQLTSRTQVFFSAAVRDELRSYEPTAHLSALLPERFENWDTLSRAQYLEAAFFLPGYLLSSQGDRVAMAHSVESRYPFLDHRVVEFAAGLPSVLKMKALNEKYLLKRAFANVVPEAIQKRPKQPYRAPDAVSFFDPATGKARHSYVDEMLSPESIHSYGIFDAAAVQKLVKKVKTSGACGFVDNAALVGILSTQLLIHQFISKSREEVSHAVC